MNKRTTNTLKSLLIASVLLVVAFITGCNDSTDDSFQVPEPQLSFENEIENLPKDSGTYEIALKSNLPWRTKLNPVSWAKLVNQNGQGNDVVRVTLLANNGIESRETVLTTWITSDYSKEIRIVQMGIGKQILLSAEEAVFEAKGGESYIEVLANVKWKVLSAPEWITTRTDNKGVYVSCNINEQSVALSGEVILSDEEEQTQVTLKVSQNPLDQMIALAQRLMKVSNSDQALQVDVKANLPVIVQASAEWVTINSVPVFTEGVLKDGALKFTVSANPTANLRKARIILRSVDETVSDTLAIEQDGQVQPVELSPFDKVKAMDTELGGTLSYKLLNGAAWIEQISFVGPVLKLRLKPNATDSEREAIVEVTGGDESKTYRFVQKPTSLETDREALIEFYNNSGGPEWVKVNWDITNPDISAWKGVVLENNRVVELNFAGTSSGNGMRGNLSGITKLYKLKKLYLTGESFASISSDIGDLVNLEFLVLNTNSQKIEGGIPASIVNCTKLYYIHMARNKLDGSVTHLAQLKNLQTLQLYENEFTGALPFSVDWSGMIVYNLHTNYFEGSIPLGFGKALSWTDSKAHFAVKTNNLTGSVPADLKSVPNWATKWKNYTIGQRGGTLTE